MKRIVAFLGFLAALLFAAPVLAQTVQAQTVTACGTPPNTPVVGNTYNITQDTTGKLCTSASGGGGGGAVYGPTAAGAANANPPIIIGGTATGATGGNVTVAKVDTSGNLSVIGATATTTQAGGTITTHGVFQSALASSATRKGCLLQNTSSETEYVFFGATGSATTSNAFQVAAGNSVSCASPGGLVLTDNIAITSITTDGVKFVVSSQ